MELSFGSGYVELSCEVLLKEAIKAITLPLGHRMSPWWQGSFLFDEQKSNHVPAQKSENLIRSNQLHTLEASKSN